MATFSDELEVNSRLDWLRRNRVAVVLVSALLVGLGILAVISTTSLHGETVPWSFAGETHDGLTLHLVAHGGGCDQRPAKVRVSESAVRVQILVDVTTQSGYACPAIAYAWKVTVSLQHPLGQRPLSGCVTGNPEVAYPQCSRLVSVPPIPYFKNWPAPAASY